MIPTFALILAGGNGSRAGAATSFGKALPKQFLRLGSPSGLPMFISAAAVFAEISDITEIVVVLPEAFVTFGESLLAEYSESLHGKKITVIPGGANRNESLRRGAEYLQSLQSLNGCDAEKTVVLTHDAARPFVTAEIIRANIAAVSSGECRACTTAVPVKDTVFFAVPEAVSGAGNSTRNNSVSAIPDRRQIYLAQTPQTFTLGLLAETFARLEDTDVSGFTDACGLVRAAFPPNELGTEIRIVPGDYRNVKITDGFDVELYGKVNT
ncbi:ribitol-5-phosphate cytidylyltransferase [Clostridia bacterium]|nr:ribitol-5-phosphate cytidylyltransferase [Clostridia bacterium]